MRSSASLSPTPTTYKVIKEIEVPDELVKEALAFVKIKNKFDGIREKFEELLK